MGLCIFLVNLALRLGELHIGRYINYEFNVLDYLPVNYFIIGMLRNVGQTVGD